MRRPGRWACLGLTFCCFFAAALDAAAGLSVRVAAPDQRHIAWVSVQRLAELGRARSVELEPAPDRGGGNGASAAALRVLPLRELAATLPELSALELPFFFRNLEAIHRALDSALGERLKSAARERGWELLAVWDEGIHLMSGNITYTHPRTLQGAEFVLLRDDPIAEIELRALDSWSRRARPSSLAQLQKECLVSSRSTTAQQMVREGLARVHLDITLSRHRYEGWVVAMPLAAWRALSVSERDGLSAALKEMTGWQRERALEAEEAALRGLARDGMTMHPLAPETWTRYRAMQPDWDAFRPAGVKPELWRELVVLAARAAGVGGGGRSDPPSRETNPRTP